jgi:hypothetical protein
LAKEEISGKEVLEIIRSAPQPFPVHLPNGRTVEPVEVN